MSCFPDVLHFRPIASNSSSVTETSPFPFQTAFFPPQQESHRQLFSHGHINQVRKPKTYQFGGVLRSRDPCALPGTGGVLQPAGVGVGESGHRSAHGPHHHLIHPLPTALRWSLPPSVNRFMCSCLQLNNKRECNYPQNFPKATADSFSQQVKSNKSPLKSLFIH